MDTQIWISEITIYSRGDESVGIFSSVWIISGDIYIDKEDVELFRKELKKTWEYISDDAQIIFDTDKEEK